MKRRLLVAVLVGAAVMVVPQTPLSAVAEPRAAAKGPDGQVTLVTGDRVTVRSGQAQVQPGPGRAGISFSMRTDARGDLHVVPVDVQGDIAAGRLDKRLFAVSALIRDRFDDASTKVTPLIVTSSNARIAGRALPSVNGVAVKAEKGKPFLSGARSAGVTKVWLDGAVKATLDRSVPQVGAPDAWQAGHTGAGTKVAVLDTGVDSTHPDLADAVVDSRNFTSSDTTDDLVGHGTHVAATITGSGQYKGVAPDAKLLNGKVLDDAGYGAESQIIAGMEWAAASGADVVNMSLGSNQPSDGTDPISQALNRLTADTGALFVVAAGNKGPSEGTIGSPAAADAALTVGSVDRADALAESSSRGPRLGDGAIKPDITAPGVGIVAAKAANGWVGTPVGDRHVALSGTSMATPHVAGAAAILAGQHPKWTAEQLKAALVGSAKPNPAVSTHYQGTGRLDVARASRQNVTASPTGFALGTAKWPHNDDAPIVRKLTYTNSGDTPLNLQITADVRSPNGPAPAGMVTASPSAVTVPAGGMAEIAVTTITSLDSPDGRYTGVVVATGNGVSVRTALSFTKEVESYDVKLTAIDHSGQPSQYFYYGFNGLDQPLDVSEIAAGEVVRRLPKGRYFFDSQVITQLDAWWNTQFVEPAQVVDRDTHLTLDARQGRKVSIAVERPNAQPGNTVMLAEANTASGYTNAGFGGVDFERQLWVPSRTSLPGAARFLVQARLAEPDGKGGFEGSDYQYNVFWENDGRVPDNLHRVFKDRSLGRVNTVSAAQAPDKMGYRDHMAGGPMPLRVTEYFSPELEWGMLFAQMRMAEFFQETLMFTARPRRFAAGTERTERWNLAVFGPALPDNPVPDRWAGRLGDYMQVALPMFTDQSSTHVGYSEVDSARTTLSRDGKIIGQSNLAGTWDGEIPADRGTYKLDVATKRSGIAELSTAVQTTWTFASETVAGNTPAPLPLLVVRFAPLLDDNNRAPAGKPFMIPVYAQRNGTTSTEGVQTPSIQVSYDDGETWRPAGVSRFGSRWMALVDHPAGAKYVSLKARTQDAAGNAVDQTIIRAYALK
ncbi:subtilisin family serine protease [Kibdelosporangium banguiense]|uniref:Subtilisin family serine protease n=1 Tax=Kibdelosporangium banguiense TaxID=1365924 RepID=A0ABS4U039_9PSEU|nr:S8 family serine peptidase [Kibdelosporangium banguiense]MBP2330010.1 subtilisin family serine protease [Kibdelosporangium banguiense]